MNFERGEDQLAIIRDIFTKAYENNLFIFIKGGWNIDLHLGKQSRDHDDIDFHFNINDKEFWKNYFEDRAFSKEENKFSLTFKKDDLTIDFRGIRISSNEIIWDHGGRSKISEVCEEKVFQNFTYRGMLLSVEKYLKERKPLRNKDKKDLEILNKLLH